VLQGADHQRIAHSPGFRHAEALLDKLDRLLRLRRLPAADKHLALMFWNHPEGEKNVAASHPNVPAS
ncbi:cobaltochelatase subunit CobN, partial [Pseudomonas aeruginosa]